MSDRLDSRLPSNSKLVLGERAWQAVMGEGRTAPVPWKPMVRPQLKNMCDSEKIGYSE